MPVSQVFLISEQFPATTKLRASFDAATAELHRHIEMLRFFLAFTMFLTMNQPVLM